MRTYNRDRRGRFARTSAGKKYRRTGAVAGAALLVGGPAFMPLGAGVGYAAGRALDRRVSRRR
jgi:hypothetical protein